MDASPVEDDVDVRVNQSFNVFIQYLPLAIPDGIKRVYGVNLVIVFDEIELVLRCVVTSGASSSTAIVGSVTE